MVGLATHDLRVTEHAVALGAFQGLLCSLVQVVRLEVVLDERTAHVNGDPLDELVEAVREATTSSTGLVSGRVENHAQRAQVEQTVRRELKAQNAVRNSRVVALRVDFEVGHAHALQALHEKGNIAG